MLELSPISLTPRVNVALKWIISILEEENIPYQVLGGVAARFYGADRPINDIDIDIQEKDFPRLLKKVGKFVQFGPELYIDSEWVVLMMALNYKGQIIELTNGDSQKIFDDASSEWKIFRYSLNDTYPVNWAGKRLKLMKPDKMVRYKSYLHGEKQLRDIQVIKEFIKNSR